MSCWRLTAGVGPANLLGVVKLANRAGNRFPARQRSLVATRYCYWVVCLSISLGGLLAGGRCNPEMLDLAAVAVLCGIFLTAQQLAGPERLARALLGAIPAGVLGAWLAPAPLDARLLAASFAIALAGWLVGDTWRGFPLLLLLGLPAGIGLTAGLAWQLDPRWTFQTFARLAQLCLVMSGVCLLLKRTLDRRL